MTRDEKIDLGARLSSLLAFLLGWQRVSGAIVAADGIYAITRGRKVNGYTSLALGSSFMIFPSWPQDLVDAFKSKSGAPTPALPMTFNQFKRASIVDEIIDGNWTVLDMSEARNAATAAKAANLQEGNTVSLVLQSQGGGPPTVFNVRVISPVKPPRYTAAWVSKTPQGGPRLVEFGQQHVFAVR